MSPSLHSLLAAASLSTLAVGAGALVTPRHSGNAVRLDRQIQTPRLPSRPENESVLQVVALRLALGLAVLGGLPIVLHELLGLRVRPWSAVAAGLLGLGLMVCEWRARGPEASRAGGVRGPARADAALLLLSLAVALGVWRGATRFPMFEGRDPWGHALGIAWIAESGSLRQPDASFPTIQYVDAYPPLFDVLMSLPVRLAGSLNGPVKAVNAVLVGGAVLVLWALALELTRDRRAALLAAGFWAVLPSAPTRHVWGHSLAVVLLLAGLLCALKARESRTYVLPGAISFGGALLAAPSQGVVNGALLLVTAALALVFSRAWGLRLVAMGSLAILLGLVWFGGVFARHGTDPVAIAAAMQPPALRRSGLTEKAMAAKAAGERPDVRSPFEGASSRAYDLDDFLFFRPHEQVLRWKAAKQMSDIAPEGIGVTLAVLSLAGLARAVRRPLEVERLLPAVWLLAALVGLMGFRFGLTFFTWRFWLTLAPLAALLAARTLATLPPGGTSAVVAVALLELVVAASADAGDPVLWRYLAANPPLLVALLALAFAAFVERLPPRVGAALAAVALVAMPARARVLTREVPPKAFHDAEERAGYERVLRETRGGEPVFPLSGGTRIEVLAGLDRPSRAWGPELDLLRPRGEGAGETPRAEEVLRVLRAEGYRYVTLDPSYRRQGPERFESVRHELRATAGVREVFSTGSFSLFDIGGRG